MSEPRRRKDDESWIKSHHILASFIAIFVGLTAYAFTTFATLRYVDARDAEIRDIIYNQHQEIKASLTEIKDEVKDSRQELMNIIRKNR